MYKSILFLFLSFFVFYGADAQVFPRDGDSLCYRLIGFSFPAQAGTLQYKIEIAKGIHTTGNTFEKNITVSVISKKNKVITEVPSFGCKYTWRVVCLGKNKQEIKSNLYHFSTKTTPDVDTSVLRLRILKNAKKYKDGYVFIDGARTLYDMKGNAVWFLPGTDLKVNRNAFPRDLKASPQGTITFLTGDQPYEITYGGTVIWYFGGQHPIPDHIHHEFTRLQNGHYMGLVYKNEYRQLPDYKGRFAVNAADSALFYQHIQYNNIVEYDADKHLIWQWNGYDYLKNSDLSAKPAADGTFDLNDLHENSFYFDEKDKTVYLSSRNISRILKIKYPEGTVLNTYGTMYKAGATQMGNELFCSQHCCSKSQKGYLYLYNNNTCSKSHIPTIEMLEEPPPGETKLKKVWEYQCTVEGQANLPKENLYFNSGGNVAELPDGSMFVLMGKPYSKAFIVSHDKNILWSAIPEKYNPVTKKWDVFTNLYRASIISRKEVERLIEVSQKY